MIRALFDQKRLYVSVPGRPGQMATWHSQTVEDLESLKVSIDAALAERQKFLDGPYTGPSGKLD